MKKIFVLIAAVFVVVLMIYAGLQALMQELSYGPFITFIGICTAVGLGIDIYNHVQLLLRKGNVRKLGRF